MLPAQKMIETYLEQWGWEVDTPTQSYDEIDIMMLSIWLLISARCEPLCSARYRESDVLDW